MGLPSFYEKGTETGVVNSIEKEKKDKIIRQKNLTPEERKNLFNRLSPEDKRRCLVDIKNKQPVTPGDIEDTWYRKNGQAISVEALMKIKQETANYTTSARYYSWIRKGESLLLREFDDKFREIKKSYSQIIEKNDLVLLVKGENILKDQGLVTFKVFLESKGG